MSASFFKTQYERGYYGFHRVRNAWPIWYRLLNRESRMAWSRYPYVPDALAQRIIQSLRADGIALAHISEFAEGENAFARMQEYVSSRLRDPKVSAEADRRRGLIAQRLKNPSGKGAGKYFKDFWVDLLELDEKGNSLFAKGNPFLRFLLHDRVLGPVASYLGMAPKLNSFHLRSTLLVPAGSREYLSQRWHRDPEDKKMMKVFIYMTDVLEPGAGPFVYVRGSHLGGKWRGIFPQRPPAGSYPPAGEVERLVPESDIQTNLAKAGTLIFCDTSGLHRGGYSTTKNRVMFMPGFTSQASRYPISFVRPTAEQKSGLSELAQYAVE